MDKISLGHGAGGSLTHTLIKELFLKNFDNAILRELGDSAVIKAGKHRLAFTTDSYVVSPLFFSGGDIGKLAICGTVNDLSVAGARPLFISCALIIEEGFETAQLEKIVVSMKNTASMCDVKIVTGDTKVVEKGACDKIFITTSGIGIIEPNILLGINKIKPKDKIIINGPIGDHGVAIMAERNKLNLGYSVKSDCAPVNELTGDILASVGGVKFMRDPTRGGIAATLNEVTECKKFGIVIDETKIPINTRVRAATEILGLDPLYMANEGKVLIFVSDECAQKALRVMQRHKLGKRASVIGEVVSGYKGKVCLKTSAGGLRLVDMPVAEQLPRIC